MKRLVALLLALMMLVSVLAGCGGNQDKTPGDNNTPNDNNQNQTDNNTPTTPENPGNTDDNNTPATPEGWTEADATETLTVHISSAAHTLSKWETTAGDMMTDLCYLVFDPVLWMEEDGTISPWLAEEYKMADDGMSIDFKFRDDVYFTNGEHLTAEDVAFTFEQIRDDTEHYPDAIVKNWRNYLGEMEVTGDYTMTMHFSQLMPEFWSLIVDNSLQVIDKETFEKIGWEEYFKSPIGTGPYEFTNVDTANSTFELTLRSDEHGYWGYDYSGRHTNVKKIIFATSTESQTRIASLKSGEVSIIDAVPTADKQSLDDAGMKSIVLNPNQSVFLEFNCRPGTAFADEKLREALSLVLDRQLIVDALLDGYAIPGFYPCLEGNLGFREEYKYEYDKERAKQLVSESSYDGSPLKFIYTTSTVAIANELCQAIQQMAQEIGINFELVPQDVAVFDAERLAANCDICLSAIVKSGNMWYKTAANVVGDDRFNSGYENQPLKDLGLQIQTVLDQDTMDGLLAQMYEIEMSEFTPVLYLYYPTLLAATQNNVSGILSHNRHYLDCSAVTIG